MPVMQHEVSKADHASALGTSLIQGPWHKAWHNHRYGVNERAGKVEQEKEEPVLLSPEFLHLEVTALSSEF